MGLRDPIAHEAGKLETAFRLALASEGVRVSG